MGRVDDYLVGEKKFLQLYEIISRNGWICNYPRPLRRYEKFGGDLEKIFIDSLREERLMDGFSVEFGVRVKGRYDRTDVVIAESLERIEIFKAAVMKCGLFVLPK